MAWFLDIFWANEAVCVSRIPNTRTTRPRRFCQQLTGKRDRNQSPGNTPLRLANRHASCEQMCGVSFSCPRCGFYVFHSADFRFFNRFSGEPLLNTLCFLFSPQLCRAARAFPTVLRTEKGQGRGPRKFRPGGRGRGRGGGGSTAERKGSGGGRAAGERAAGEGEGRDGTEAGKGTSIMAEPRGARMYKYSWLGMLSGVGGISRRFACLP